MNKITLIWHKIDKISQLFIDGVNKIKSLKIICWLLNARFQLVLANYDKETICDWKLIMLATGF